MKKIYIITLLLLFSLLPASSIYAVKWTAYKICIDPGHGGTDPGALGPSAPHEGELALQCGLALRDKLTSMGAPVGMTRTANTTVSLTARKNYFLNQDPYIALSIHLNAFNTTAHGTETWYYWETGNSKSLAQKMQAALVSQLKRADRGVKQNGWTVITASSNIPSVLTEGLFVDNATEWGMINKTSNAGFQAWVNGHLYGCYDHLIRFNANLDNPRNTLNPAITVTPESYSYTCPSNETRTASFTVSGKDLSSNISVSSNSTNFVVSTGSLTTSGGTISVTFKPSAATTYSGVVTLTSGTTSKKITVSGTGTAVVSGPLSFTEAWNLSESKGTLNLKGWNASLVRNMAYGFENLYLVYNHSDIKVVKATTGEQLYNLNKTNISGGTLALCDVRICAGKILACNLTTGSTPLKVYKWDSDTSTPTVILETTNLGGATRLGDCLGFVGDWTNGKLVFAHDDGSKTRIVSYAITNGVCNTTPSVIFATTDGSTRLACSSSIRIMPDANGYWINGKDNPLTRLNTSGQMLYQVAQSNHYGNGFAAFSYNGTQYGLLTTFISGNYGGGCMQLIDASKGWAQGESLGFYPSTGLGATANTNCTGTCIAVASGNTVEAWVLSTGQGIAYFKNGVSTRATLDIETEAVNKDVSVVLSGRTLKVDGLDAVAIEIYSLTGQKVAYANYTNQMSLDALDKGVYIVLVTDNKGLKIKEKVLVR